MRPHIYGLDVFLLRVDACETPMLYKKTARCVCRTAGANVGVSIPSLPGYVGTFYVATVAGPG